jgi:formate dehydrogenase (NADP+) beta subunit
VGTDAGAYVTAIAAGDWAAAYAAARAHNPFPSVCGRVCAAPCEDACRRAVIDAPVAIRALKRTATAHFGVESAAGATAWHAAHGPVPPASRPSVAIVGAGPAGLAAAHDLRLAGHPVVIHEATDRAGGMMALGIPAFRLPRALLDAEIAAIVSLGVELRLNSAVGRDVTLETLLEEHAAVFVASGCGRGRELEVPGRELKGVVVAVEYLLHVNQGAPPPLTEHVVVIGGGSVAFDAARMAVRTGDGAADAGLHTSLDAARAAKRAGSRDVTIIALESREELPADAAELAAAEAEGIRIRFRTAVTRIEGDQSAGSVARVVLTPVQRVFDARGNFAPELDRDAPEEPLIADTVIVAVGQRAESGFVPDALAVPRTGFGGLVINPATGRTAHPRLWAGGDVARGPRLLIEAVADGRRAAASIHRTLGGLPVEDRPLQAAFSPAPLTDRWRSDYDQLPRAALPHLPDAARIPDAEVELGLDDAAARREGSRCLRCFEQVMLETSRCILCGLCADVCPVGSISLVAAGTTGRWHLALDETACLRCGLCIARCPGGALSLAHAAEACALRAPERAA